MSYLSYKVIHYLGIFLFMATLGASVGRQLGGGGEDPLRRRFSTLQGVSLFLVLLGGFGLLARIGVEHGALFPGWVWGKLTLWTLLGGVMVVARRRPSWAFSLLLCVPLLGVVAGYLALRKPF